jgi:hypothetical protein
MIVSFHGVLGARSASQSKPSSTTTLFGMAGALSVSSGCRSASSLPSATYGSVFARSHRTVPSTAFAYGSIRSFAELKRRPSRAS